jgi:NhaP-type Na+/H+ or K+/H+ antiporter
LHIVAVNPLSTNNTYHDFPNMATTVLAVGLFVFAAYFFKAVFDKTGVPDVLSLIVCGILIGPVFGYVSPASFGQAGGALATLALAVILFESSVDLDLASLRPSLSATLKITLTTFVVTAAIAAGIGKMMADLSVMGALMLGAILAGSSSAVVIPLVQSLNVQGKARTMLILVSALTDVLCIVGLFMFLEAAKKGAASPGHILLTLIETLVIAAAIGVLAGMGWLMVLRRVRHGGHAPAAM